MNKHRRPHPLRSLRARNLFGIAGIVVLFGAAATFSLLLHRYSANHARLIQQRWRMHSELTEASAALDQVRRSLAQAAEAENEAPQGTLVSNLARLESARDRLGEIPADASFSFSSIPSTSRQRDDLEKQLVRIVPIVRSLTEPGPDAAEDLREQFISLHDPLAQDLHTLTRILERDIEEATGAIEVTHTRARVGWIALALALSGINLVWAFGLRVYLWKPLGIIRQAIERLGRREFNERVVLYQHDEVGQLGTSFNRMAEQLAANVNFSAFSKATELKKRWSAIEKVRSGCGDLIGSAGEGAEAARAEVGHEVLDPVVVEPVQSREVLVRDRRLEIGAVPDRPGFPRVERAEGDPALPGVGGARQRVEGTLAADAVGRLAGRRVDGNPGQGVEEAIG